MVKWVSEDGQRTPGTIGRNAERGENVRGARHLGDEFGVVPNVRVVEAVGRAEERRAVASGVRFALATSAA
jgi:hypothetical protein